MNLIFGFLILIISIFGSLGNAIVLVLLARTKKLRKRYCFVLNFTACHIVAACSYVGIAYKAILNKRFTDNSLACILDGLVLGIVSNAATYFLLLVAIEHYLVTQYPFLVRKLTMNRKLVLVLVAYTMALLTNIPPVFGWGNSIRPLGYGWFCSFDIYDQSRNNRSYFIFLYSCTLLLPFGVMIVLYAIIWRNSFRRSGQSVRCQKERFEKDKVQLLDGQKLVVQPGSDQNGAEQDFDVARSTKTGFESVSNYRQNSITVTANNPENGRIEYGKNSSKNGRGMSEEGLNQECRQNRRYRQTLAKSHYQTIPEKASYREAKFLKNSLSLVILFCFAWLPFTITSLIVQFTRIEVSPVAIHISTLFAKTFILWNPLMHAVNDRRFRNEFVRISAGLLNYEVIFSPTHQQHLANRKLLNVDGSLMLPTKTKHLNRQKSAGVEESGRQPSIKVTKSSADIPNHDDQQQRYKNGLKISIRRFHSTDVHVQQPQPQKPPNLEENQAYWKAENSAVDGGSIMLKIGFNSSKSCRGLVADKTDRSGENGQTELEADEDPLDNEKSNEHFDQCSNDEVLEENADGSQNSHTDATFHERQQHQTIKISKRTASSTSSWSPSVDSSVTSSGYGTSNYSRSTACSSNQSSFCSHRKSSNAAVVVDAVDDETIFIEEGSID